MNVYVFGIEHLGLPFSIWAALNGHNVCCIDDDYNLIENVQKGNVNICEYYEGEHISQITKKLISEKKLTITNKLDRSDTAPATFIINIGIEKQCIYSILDSITPSLCNNDLIIFRASMIPGTCDDIINNKLLKLPFRLNICYCAENISEGHFFQELKDGSNILAGYDDDSFIWGKDFFKSLSFAPVYKASNIRTAETIKVMQDISTDVNIALANELSEVCSILNIDMVEVKALANANFKTYILNPAPGVGGISIPNALYYLKESVNTTDNIDCLKLCSTARTLNKNRPLKVVLKIKEALLDCGKNLKDCTIAVLGLAMKDFSSDLTSSPALDIISILLKEGANVKAYDPAVNKTLSYKVSSFDECIEGSDCILITTKQLQLSYNIDKMNSLMNKPLIVVDTKNTFPISDEVSLYRI